MDLAPGDTLLIYTDGVTEALDPDGEEYGLQRLTTLCIDRSECALPELVTALERELERWVHGAPWEDDVTIVAVQRT